MSANTWALTLILHRTQRVADEAINRALDCSLTSHRGAPWCNGMLHGATVRRVFHPETNGVKASPHRHKWMLSHGAPADPSDPWNSHAAPVSPRQNGHLAVLQGSHVRRRPV